MAATRLRLGLLGLAVVVAAGVGIGIYFALQDRDDDDKQVIVGPSATQTRAVATDTPPRPTATAVPPTEPPPTAPPATAAPPVPTQDTRVAIRDVPSADQIQLGPDGRYFVADRGDGCTWAEYSRITDPYFGLEIQFSTDCPADFGITFRPETGEVVVFMP